VSRFEIEENGGDGEGGSPRSFSVRFEFAKDRNEWFEDEVLEKRFWYRRGRDGSVGLVSEPVRIRWRKGRDLTDGLGEAVCRLWEARRKAGLLVDGASAAKLQGLQEYRALVKKLENETEGSPSFFLLFGFVSSLRWVSEEESREANALEMKRREQRKNGEKVEPLPEEIEVEDETEIEVCPHGEDLANVIAEDVWPGAIKYFSMWPTITSLVVLLIVSQLQRRRWTMMRCQRLISKTTTRMRRTSRLTSEVLCKANARIRLQLGVRLR